MIKMQCIPYDDAHFLDYIKPEWSIEDDPSEGFILLIDDEIAFGCAFVSSPHYIQPPHPGIDCSTDHPVFRKR